MKAAIKDVLIENAFNRLGAGLVSRYGPPVILMGMHRSGTSLVTRLLREAGGYYGRVLEENSEAVPFIKINNRLLISRGCRWYSIPVGIDWRSLSGDLKAKRAIVYAQDFLDQLFFDHFGEAGAESELSRYRGAATQSRRSLLRLIRTPSWQTARGSHAPFWGWKDPRNSLTLSLWLGFFPGSRVVHVVRNGMDCALSLWNRSRAAQRPSPCLDLPYCFDLWEHYTRPALSWRDLGHKRYHEIRYEDILKDPEGATRGILRFVGVDAVDVPAICTMVDFKHPPKDYAKDFPELFDHAQKSPLFRELGYASAP